VEQALASNTLSLVYASQGVGAAGPCDQPQAATEEAMGSHLRAAEGSLPL
jgi:hypothetical protein